MLSKEKGKIKLMMKTDHHRGGDKVPAINDQLYEKG